MAVSGATPGRIQVVAAILRPPTVSSMVSWKVSFSRSAVRGPRIRAFSQTSLVTGLGSSWSQTLLA